MAEQKQNPGAVTNSFTKGMVKDFNDTFIGEGLWSHARNAVNNSGEGQVGVIGNEPANLFCVTLPYDLIGCIHLGGDRWAIFTTNDINSEIGIFDESQCTYTKVVNSACLNFKRSNLITGISRRRYDCERPIYWADGLNPDRFIDLDNIPYKYTEKIVNGCIERIYTTELDCERIRLAAYIKHPCIQLTQGKVAGSLFNGSYQVALAYTINGAKVSDYIGISEVQSVFTHENTNSSLEVKILDIDTTFDTFNLILIARVNEQTFVREIGEYSTSQGFIYIDRIDFESPTVPIQNILLRTEPIEKSDAIYTVNDYALRVGTYSKFKFNYQPQANSIRSKWVAVEYPSDYYYKGGNNTSYLRDEQYAFFIRFIYNTGERSESYHIPGRAATASDIEPVFGTDAYETFDGVSVRRWQVENTATVDNLLSTRLPDGGRLIASGQMGYWESTELYPAEKPNIWGTLCGKPIRHHKFPDVTVQNGNIVNHFTNGGDNIVLLGVQFDNITAPLDINGNPIASIVGYEILRGSRQGNKSIMAKGMFNNMREYDIPGNTTIKGLYQNYPYNDLSADSYLSSRQRISGNGVVNVTNSNSPKLNNFKKDIFSFHSPEVTFTNPFLNVDEVKIYQELHGQSLGQFENPYRHPKFKILSNFASIISKLIGIVSALDMIANGVEIAATEDFPISRKIGPIPLWSFNPSTLPVAGPGSSGGGSAPGAIINNTFGTVWNIALGVIGGVAAIANIISSARTLAELQTEKMYSLLRILAPKRQYAAQYNSHGFYNQSQTSTQGNRRRKIVDASYIGGSNLQYFNNEYQVNNINRSSGLVVQVGQDIANPTQQDNSRTTIGESNAGLYNTFSRKIASHYGALKFNIPSQYGQLESVKQLPISFCVQKITPDKIKKFSSDVLFGGDTYINRFTEKNTMFFFNTWLMGEQDEVEFDYTEQVNVPWPRFWIHNTQYHSALLKLADDYRALDDRFTAVGSIYVGRGYFYLFNSGVRDFYVESEVNLAYRDWEDDFTRRHYDPQRYTDLSMMFRSDIIKSGNYYKYDYSLSINKLFNSQNTWGELLPRDYDPVVAATCFTYRPNRVIYSLQQQDNSKEDNWRVFLANNYRDLSSRVTVIKPINSTGALFMMRDRSPQVFLGEEQLKMDGTGAVISIGDGNLFNQNGQLRSIVNADRSYEYGSCQSKFANVSNVFGVFWVSQDQGKVFQYTSQIQEISRDGMKWWFSRYLPSELLKVYPNYPLFDNPVVGVGVQMIYDNTNEVIYISKKDYKPKRSDLLYDPNGFYYISGYTTVTTPGQTTQSCPVGFTLTGNQCVKRETSVPTQSGTIFNVTRTPFQVYGISGTRLYNSATLNSSFTLLNTSNPFWIRSANPGNWNTLTAAQKQAFDLNNGPVNRLSVWGVQTGSNGQPLNNYTITTGSLPPINTWVGFDVCINITETKTYYVCIAADNSYRFSLNGTLLLSDISGTTTTFTFLHIYPVTITAGNHILRLEGRNNGQLAGFGCEIFDLSNLPGGISVINYLNAQVNYDDLDARTIFTTRSVTQFTSNLYTCPSGFNLVNPRCDEPICEKVTTTSPTTVTTPPVITQVPIKVYVPFSDTNVWEDASWTISYDPKSKTWISFHDWKPTFMLPGKAHFLTVNKDSIWKHNIRCDLFTNYYGVDYPFEVEFVSATGQAVNSIRNIEYLLEAYKYHNHCADKFHVLDENFDQAVVYNSEQISGLLELNLKSKTNPLSMLSFPQLGPQSIKILFSKEEQKYRFNQFWDITKERGEFSSTTNVPMFKTSANGYEYPINADYVNYQKGPLERKKFRHNVNRVFLRKVKSADVKLLFKISNQKLLQSPR
jgi:hypothetical protein